MLCAATACLKRQSLGPPGGKASSATHGGAHRLDGNEDVVLKLRTVAESRDANSAADAVDAPDCTDAVGAAEATAADVAAAGSATAPAEAMHRLDIADSDRWWMPDELPLPCSDKTSVAASSMSLFNRVRISTGSVFI